MYAQHLHIELGELFKAIIPGNQVTHWCCSHGFLDLCKAVLLIEVKHLRRWPARAECGAEDLPVLLFGTLNEIPCFFLKRFC